MKTKVFIPFNNEKVFTGNPRRKSRYQDDFRSWVTTTLGQVSGGMWGTEPHLTTNRYTATGMTFWFKDPSHAMMFKLTWA